MDEAFEVKPSASEAPDECEYRGCSKPTEMTVRFRDPKEYVCYCEDCSGIVMSELPTAKSRMRL